LYLFDEGVAGFLASSGIVDEKPARGYRDGRKEGYKEGYKVIR
jgi:hypothetical protein